MSAEPTAEQMREAVRLALVDRCTTCWRPIATDEQWETVPEGGRDDLCWDEVTCGYDVGITEEGLIVDALRPLFARALAAAVTADRARIVAAIEEEWDEECAGNRNADRCESCRAYGRAISLAR